MWLNRVLSSCIQLSTFTTMSWLNENSHSWINRKSFLNLLKPPQFYILLSLWGTECTLREKNLTQRDSCNATKCKTLKGVLILHYADTTVLYWMFSSRFYREAHSSLHLYCPPARRWTRDHQHGPTGWPNNRGIQQPDMGPKNWVDEKQYALWILAKRNPDN